MRKSGDIIAYIKGKKLYFYNLTNKESNLFYNPMESELIVYYRWSPDGEYIFMLCGGRGKYEEKLISVKDGKVIEFEPLGVQYHNITWKR